MNLLDQIKSDVATITGNGADFGTPLTFEKPDGTTVTVIGLASKHHLSFDNDGRPINGKNAHVSVSEVLLTEVSFNVRNAKSEVHMKDYRVSWTDSTGTLKKYIIQEWLPDETIGLIVCLLGSFKE